MAHIEVEFFRFNDQVSTLPTRKPPPTFQPFGTIGTALDTHQCDRRNPLVGKPVTITGKHSFSGYHGLIKVVCANGSDLQIELEATTRVVEVPMAYVFIRYLILSST